MADGINPLDVVNKRQLDDVAETAYAGIASVAAMSAIPAPLPDHRFAFGMAAGYYKEEGAFAAGLSANIGKRMRLTGAVGIGTSGDGSAAIGAGYSW